jgi:hypothetical protein
MCVQIMTSSLALHDGIDAFEIDDYYDGSSMSKKDALSS